jgi:flagellar basal-body rod protein FlgB
LDIDFGKTVDLIKNAMAGSGLNNTAIANNVANFNTPGYRRETVNFKEALARTLGTPADPNELALVTDAPGQMGDGGAAPPEPYQDPKIEIDNPLQMRLDHSNVDVDQEMAQMAQNTAYSQTMAQILRVQYQQLDTVFKESP